jgi:hypothetical protein
MNKNLDSDTEINRDLKIKMSRSNSYSDRPKSANQYSDYSDQEKYDYKI